MKPPVGIPPGDAAHDEATLRFYAEEAPVYAARARAGPSRRLDAFLALLAPGARVLELGCGDGQDSEAMLARGFEVDTTDGSPAMRGRPRRGLAVPSARCGSTS